MIAVVALSHVDLMCTEMEVEVEDIGEYTLSLQRAIDEGATLAFDYKPVGRGDAGHTHFLVVPSRCISRIEIVEKGAA